MPGLGLLFHQGLANVPAKFRQQVPVGLQLYSLKDQLTAPGTDVRRQLEAVAAIGVKELETAAGEQGLYYGYRPKEFFRITGDLGMKWIGNHIGGIPRSDQDPSKANKPNLRDNLDAVLDGLAEGGCRWAVCAGSAIATPDEIKATTALFVKAADEAGKRGMNFAYHNHKREFEKVGDTTAFQYIMEHTDEDKVFMQLDLGWAVMAGADPVDLFRQYPKRFPLWHVKDFSAATQKPCVIGTGIVDFKRIFQHAHLAGLKHAFIEQDNAKSVQELSEGVKWLMK